MNYSPDIGNGFFSSIVGGQGQIEEFRASLSSYVADANSGPASSYYGLLVGYNHAVMNAVELGQKDSSGLDPDELTKWDSIETHAIGGGRLIVAALQTLGDIYTQNLTVDQIAIPQNPESVSANVSSVIDHIYEMGYTGRSFTKYNDALQHGLNPNRLGSRPLGRLLTSFRLDPAISHRSFSVNSDESGQLAIAPRFRVRTDNGDRRPVTQSTMGYSESSNSDLRTVFQVVGEVAATEIYPRQFSISHHREAISVNEG